MSLFIGYVVAIAGVIVAVLLLLVAAIDPRGFQALKGAALDATAPISGAGRSVIQGATDTGESIGDYFHAASTNAELRDQLRQAEARLVQAQAAELENQRLRALVGLRDNVHDEVAVGRIVSSSFDSARRFAVISVGRSSGVAVGQPVRAAEGLLGRILETGHLASRVLLIVDAASQVPVRLVRNGTPALAVGRGDGMIELRPLEVGANPFRRGDTVVTSGVGGIFPPDVPVAEVVGMQGDTVIARPLAAPSRVDFAIVQPQYQPAVVPPAQGGTSTEPANTPAP